LIGENPLKFFSDKYNSFEIFEIIRGYRILYPERDRVRIHENDLLLVKGAPSDLVDILSDSIVELPLISEDRQFKVGDRETLIVELIIPPQSSLLGERLIDTEFVKDPDIHLIGVKRRSLLYTEQKIRNMKLRIGDIILIQCAESKVERLRGDIDHIIIEDVQQEIINKKKGPLALLIFLGMIVAASTGMADIMVCALTAVFLMILSGCLRFRDAYRALEGNVLVLIVGAIALGTAMEKTGAAEHYADIFLNLFQGAEPQVILGGIILLTSLSTQILSNNATGVLLVPIAISTAISLGVDPKPFIIGVCFGASACFATPIGYQTNLLVYGPGGYRFTDYLKLGIPLNILVIIMGTIFIPFYWPF
jgi:di/tricarboxylate transporter